MSDDFPAGELQDRGGFRFAAIFKAEPECVKILDDSARILQMNPAGLSILEAATPAEVIGRSIFDFIVPADHEQVRLCFSSALSSGGFGCKYEVLTLAGNQRWLESHMVVLRDGSSKIEVLAVTRDVTRMIEAEGRLRESEERFRQLAENVQEVFWMLDIASEKVLYVSAAYEKIWGRSCESLIKEPVSWSECVHSEDRAMLQETLHRRQKSGFSDVEYRIIRPDGAVRWIHDRGFPIYNNTGVIYRLAGIATDITSRKLGENQLSRLQRLYRFSSRMNDAILHHRPPPELFREACQIAVEDALLEMSWVGLFNTETAELKPVAAAGRIDGYLTDFTIPVDTYPKGHGPAGRAFRTGCPAVTNNIQEDATFVTKEAALKRGYRSCAAFPIVVSGKKTGVLVFYASQIDVFQAEEIQLLQRLAENLGFAVEAGEKEAEKSRIESALAESEERFRLLVENSTDLIAEIGVGGKFHYASPNFKTVLGHDPFQLLKRNTLDLIHPDDADDVRKFFAGPGGSATHRYLHQNGSWRWLETSARRFRTSSGEDRAVVILRDVTERRERAAAQALAETRLRQSQKMEALGTLAGGIAHDFNNILALIFGNIELASMDQPPGARSQERLDGAMKAANRAADLVRQILTFSRRKDPERKALDVSQVVLEVVKLLRAGLPSTIEIRTTIPDSLPQILADSSQIYQVMMNLATNASHAMRQCGGVLDVGLSSETVESGSILTIPGLAPGRYLKITVTDSGEGMLPEVVDRVFEPFFTTKPIGEGTGLGLSVVHGIIKAHDGAIFVQSQLGHGSTFELYFPAVKTGPTLAPVGSNPGGGNGEVVLFIDDEPSICRIVEGLLRKNGYDPVVFDSPIEALQEFQVNPARFAAVVTDLTMPKMTGLTVAQEIKRVAPNIPVILVTGFAGNLPVEDLSAVGVKELLPKPFTQQALMNCLKKAIHS
ncbi:MAG: hypothetical protein JWM99_2034 [Verrucomicrobiales bacterium]|nr:hypothetical protein [Verrucomicrobiales bacterium]